MASLANMKSQLTELENQKTKLEAEIQKANQRLRLSLGGLAIGVLLLPFALYVGVPVLAIAVAVAIFYAVRISIVHDKLATLETEIHKLEISMV